MTGLRGIGTCTAHPLVAGHHLIVVVKLHPGAAVVQRIPTVNRVNVN
jgi:hypothetical protein